jgi:hypothetical protein
MAPAPALGDVDRESDAGQADGCDDEHLQQYMANFLKSHNIDSSGRSDNKEKPRAARPKPTADHTADPTADAAACRTAFWKSPPSGIPPWKRRQPASPPESEDDLREMRQLANAAARRAIKLHAFRDAVVALRLYFLVALLAVSTSITLVLRTGQPDSPNYPFAVLSFVVGSAACLCFLRRSRKVGRVSIRSTHP